MCSIRNDWSFDDGVAAKYGCVVRAFDPRLVDIWYNAQLKIQYAVLVGLLLNTK